MKRFLFLSLLCASLSFGQVVSRTSAKYVGYSTWQLHASVTGTATHLRMAYAVSPTACTAGTIEDTNGGGPGGNMSDLIYNTTGKAPGMTYNVCAQVQFGNSTWVTGPSIVVQTLGALAGPDTPLRAIPVNTDYPADILNNNAVDTYTLTSCANLSSTLDTAVRFQATRNAIITLPVGQGNTCIGNINLPQIQPDTLLVNTSNIYADAADQYVTLTGLQNGNTVASVPDGLWPDGTTIADGQAVILAQATTHGGGYNDSLPGNIFADGRLYYLYAKNAGAHQWYLYDKPRGKNGVKVGVWAKGPGQFVLVPYPRHLKDIIIRTATPDDLFAAPGTALGGLAWTSKMAWVTNAKANRVSKYGSPALTFGNGGPPESSSTLSHIRFVGIAFTVEDDPDSYKTPDPAAWNSFVGTAPTMEDVIFDRCAFFMPSVQQRNYNAFFLQGTNNAIVNSYFDYLRFFMGANDFIGGNGVHQ